jgi:uncharacterized membrane protein
MMQQIRSGLTKRNPRTLDHLLTLLLLFFLFEEPVYAYVDPGAGSLLWQIVVAGFVGVLFYVRCLLGSLLRKKEGKPSQPLLQ